MELKPIHHKVVEIDFKPYEESEEENNFILEYNPSFDFESKHNFSIIFDLTLIEEEKYIVKIKYETIFETNNIIDEDFKKTHFTYINAPAISYPFLRSFVSFLILNAGYPPLILPSINFVKASEKGK